MVNELYLAVYFFSVTLSHDAMVASVAGTLDTLDSPEDCHTRSKDLLDSFMVWSLTFDGDKKNTMKKKGGDGDQLSDVRKVSAAD